jgi:hypothetical protein
MSNGKSKELKSIVHQFIDSDDLASVIFYMISIRPLVHNPNTPLEFIYFGLLKGHFKHIICVKNKHIDRQFILDNMDVIQDRSTLRYLALHKITVDLELFNKLPEATKYFLSVQDYPYKLNVPKKILMNYCVPYSLEHFAEYPMTSDEIDHILSLRCDLDHIYGLYEALASYQYLTELHLDIMKKRNPKIASEIIEKYY